jgi:acetyl esterase
MDRAAHVGTAFRYAMPDAQPSRHDVILERDIPYASPGDRAHRLDVYIPTRVRGPLPVVMYVHGGAFSMLSKDTHRIMALALSRRGWLVFNINYRLGPRNVYPAPLEDACAALEWVAERCGSWGGDPDRIAIAGESAGGNLVTALAIVTSTRRPERFARRLFDAGVRLRAVVATYPFADLTDVENLRHHPRLPSWAKYMLFDAAHAYVGHDLRTASLESPLTSPLLILENGFAPHRPVAPFFTTAGTKDPLLGQTRRLKAALDRLGVPCDLHIAPGEIHGFDAMMWRGAARQKWNKVYDFLSRHMRSESGFIANAELDDDD